MANYLDENLRIVEQRWPAVAQSLRLAAESSGAMLVHDGPQPTLVIEGIHLSSGYDRLSEAAHQAALIPNDSADAWVYGLGLGDLPRTLLARRGLGRLNVVLLNLSVARSSFQYFRHGDWLLDERVNILTAAQLSEVSFPFAAVPSCLQLADDTSARLRDLVALELSTPFIRKRHAAEDPALQARLKENEGYLEVDGDAAELFSRYTAKTVLVAGAGPTLSEHFERLRHRKTPLIAVDAALRPLTQAGIVPDVVVTIDGDAEVVGRFLREADLSGCDEIPLVYFPTVHQGVLQTWPGPRYAAYSSAPLFQNLRVRQPRVELFSAGSVIHPAVDLAVRLGAARVVMLGADFGYPGGRSHVTGCITEEEIASRAQYPWVLDWQGRRLPTAANLRGYLRDLEAYIARQPRVVFFGGSLRGAQIHGAQTWETNDVF